MLGPQVAQAAANGDSGGTWSPPVLRQVHHVVWTLLGVTTLATVGLLTLGYFWLALAAFLGAAASGVTALVQHFGTNGRGDIIPENRRFGRGPYVACDSTPNPDLLKRLADISQQLREAAANENWSIDCGDFDTHLARADAAAQAANLADAAREHLLAIMFMMAQLRMRRATGSDSGVIG